MKALPLAAVLLANCAAASRDDTGNAGAPSDAGMTDKDVEMVAVRDATPMVSDAAGDARVKDAAALSDAGACGICDRVWVCNNLAQQWTTESDGRCVNQVNRTALRCDGTLDVGMTKDVGTWTGDAREIALQFRDLNGGTRVYYCYPK
jgi:hypothetical protein